MLFERTESHKTNKFQFELSHKMMIKIQVVGIISKKPIFKIKEFAENI